MQGASLTATDLACRRGDRLLFRGLTLSIGAGQTLHVRGPNGCGKTSLLRILGGLDAAFAGDIARMGAVGLVGDRDALDPDRTLEQSLAFWAAIDGHAGPSDVHEMLGLTHIMDVPVGYLSAGQRKRASFARLLNQRADIWLLDEPLNALDRAAQVTVLDLMARHCEGGGLCLIASHQPLDLPQLATLDLPDYAP
ncbi:heme ABC exporter ATP-binding protein CcmA [Qipengyuania sp. JC766]|uniref:heme ABC exporter ATP-binding protein CcmA n=1 Tax=Qipengyuania sp. JC766 TaxID=3232139 RepID=UPI0034596D95